MAYLPGIDERRKIKEFLERFNDDINKNPDIIDKIHDAVIIDENILDMRFD